MAVAVLLAAIFKAFPKNYCCVKSKFRVVDFYLQYTMFNFHDKSTTSLLVHNKSKRGLLALLKHFSCVTANVIAAKAKRHRPNHSSCYYKSAAIRLRR